MKTHSVSTFLLTYTYACGIQNPKIYSVFVWIIVALSHNLLGEET